MKKKFIDIDNLIKEKNPKLFKWLPRFILNYIKRITHEKEVNVFIENTKDIYDAEFCEKVITYLNNKIEFEGLENIPSTGGVHFASNHPLGGMDAMAIVHVVSRVRNDIKFIVNDVLLNLLSLKNMFVGVNKHGKTMKESLLAVDSILASDKAVFVFPAGLVSRKINGNIKDLEWKKTFISRAKKHKKSIVPVYVDGQLSDFFYKLANFRSKIGIKANIEMFYLVDELYRQKGQTIKIAFGKPVPYETFDKSKKDKEWAQWMKDKSYALK